MSEKLAEGQTAVVIDGTRFVFDRPSLEIYESYQESLVGVKRRGPIFRDLCQQCLVGDENLAALKAALAKYPAASVQIADALADAAGASLKVEVGKG